MLNGHVGTTAHEPAVRVGMKTASQTGDVIVNHAQFRRRLHFMTDRMPSHDECLDYRLLHEDGDEETIGTHHGCVGNGYWPAHVPCDTYCTPGPISDGMSTNGEECLDKRRARTQPKGTRASDPALTPAWERLIRDASV